MDLKSEIRDKLRYQVIGNQMQETGISDIWANTTSRTSYFLNRLNHSSMFRSDISYLPDLEQDEYVKLKTNLPLKQGTNSVACENTYLSNKDHYLHQNDASSFDDGKVETSLSDGSKYYFEY